jgi:hypothetical protein
MKLNDKQLKQLRLSQQLRMQEPSIGWFFLKSWKSYALLISVCALGSLYFALNDSAVLSALVAGILLGAICRDFKHVRIFLNSWPLSKEITDWKRVDDLIAENEPGKS